MATMQQQQMADWLMQRGVSEYAQCFAENRIDLSVLPDLTDQDLAHIGVVLGDRRKILRWIAEGRDIDRSAPAAGSACATPVTLGPLESAERRQITVLFSDLVGSTALSASLDPEDLRMKQNFGNALLAGWAGGFAGNALLGILFSSPSIRAALYDPLWQSPLFIEITAQRNIAVSVLGLIVLSGLHGLLFCTTCTCDPRSFLVGQGVVLRFGNLGNLLAVPGMVHLRDIA